MDFPSPAPRRVATPRWLDVRLVVGIVLVLAAVLLGAAVVSRARHTETEVAATRDLAAGTTLRSDDLRLVDVQLGDDSVYLRAADAAIGKVLTRPVASGELVPAAALGSQPARTTVTIPFAADSAPQLRRGQRIVVWLSTPSCPTVLLLSDVVVEDVHGSGTTFGSGSGGQNAVLTVAPDLAERVITALAIDKATIRAGVLTGAHAPPASGLPGLDMCGATPSPASS